LRFFFRFPTILFDEFKKPSDENEANDDFGFDSEN